MNGARPILCLGEVIVDLIGERPAAAGQVPASLVPYPGGALANVAVAIARAGVPAAISGGVGGDLWGGWLTECFEREGVSTRWLARLKQADTPLGIALLDRDGEPDFQIYGEHIGPTMAAAGEMLAEAVAACDALVIGSNTMVGPTEREVTRRASELARGHGLPVLFDPNFRPSRWDREQDARDYCLELAQQATVVRMNREEAALLTGQTDLREAARRLVRSGPELVVVTDGAGPVVAAGAVESSFQPDPVRVISPLGAGDAFMGLLVARLALAGWDLSRAAGALAPAARAAAAACGQIGAQG